MGAVYEAVHTEDGRVVALKLLSVELDNMDSRQRFLREGQTAAAINHPNAVYIYGTEEINGVPVISMELVPGGNLEEKIKERGPLPIDEAVIDILQVIDGLDAALSAGVLHRDVKPANCFVSTSGVVKIGDFGLSKPVDSAEQQKLTQTGVFLGTPVFSSPEQLLGEKLDQRSDIYAVGVTFYYLLTGALPYSSGSMMQVVAAVLNGSPAPLESHREGIPEAVRDVVMKSIARKSADRYQTYEEFREAVQSLRKPETVPATIWDRFKAAVVDGVVITIITWILFQLTMAATGLAWTSVMTQGLYLNAGISFVLALLIVAIPEGLRGLSIGKWVVGIRVAKIDGSLPGIPRALSRSLLLQLISVVSLLGQTSTSSQNARASFAFLSSVVLRLLLFVTWRRGNGNMLLHDWITGTRVIRPMTGALKRQSETQHRAAPTLSGAERKIGAYAVVGALREDSSVLLGWDPSMHRAVWIVPQNDGAAEIPQSRRDLARLTRLRWVAGRRAAGENWDAYESPLGESLSSRLERPVAWSVLQAWMLDLTGELISGQADGTLPTVLSATSLWVTSGDSILVPESAGHSDASGSDAERSLACVKSVLALIHVAAGTHAPLPRYATRAIAEAKNASSVDSIHALFKSTLGRPLSISRVRRGGLVAATIAAVVVFPTAGILPLRQAMKTDLDGRKLSGLLQFISDSSHAIPDSLKPKKAKKSTGLLTNFNNALTKTGWFPSDTGLNALSAEQYREQSRLAQIYVAGMLAPRIRSKQNTSLFGGSPKDVHLAESILKKYPTVDSVELRSARALVDSTWHANPPGVSVDLLVKVVGAVLFVFFPWFIASCAILIALIARRGALMRGFGLDIVTAKGEPAGRVRILVRNIVTWSPVLYPFALYAAIVAATPATANLVMEGAGVLCLIFLAAAVWLGIRTPERGIADRVAGTYLVPE
jgi:uncharacterized RDD family membrane protein YckC